MKPASAVIHYHRLDEQRFPELQFGPGRKGIHALMPPPPGDRRVPAPPSARPLLVVFRVTEIAPPAPGEVAPPVWQLVVSQQNADGTLSERRVVVAPQPPDGNNTRRPRPDTGPPSVGTVIYRGAWWADLSSLYAWGLRSGTPVVLSYAERERVTFSLI